MTSHIRSAATALFVALGTLAAVLTAAPAASADELICEQYGTTVIQDRYIVQNNRWGTSAAQCINVTDNGFQVTRADGSVPTNGAPKSYPSVFNGCHYTNCSPGTRLPKQLSTIGSAPSSVSYSYVDDAVYNAAYDIWLDPAPKTDGVSRTEIMIWFNRVGPIQPIGSQTGTANVGGRTWEVWTGSNGMNDVISFVAPSALSGWSFDAMDFVAETIDRGMAQPSWYMTSVQAGFEPWENGTGLAVNSFSSTVQDGTPDDGGPPGDGTPDDCRVSYDTHVWPGGFTADATITNTGDTPVDGWELTFTLPSGQQITHGWNARISPSSGTVTARDTGSNGSLAPGGGSQSFGFQGTYSGGTFGEPARFALNGTTCAMD